MTYLLMGLATIFLGNVAISLGQNPGMKSRITPNGINFMEYVGVEMLEAKIKDLPIPERCGSSYAGIVTYCASGMHVTDASIENIEISASSGNVLAVSVSGVSVSIEGYYEYTILYIPSGSGSLSASISATSLSLRIMIGLDDTGHPTVSTDPDYCALTVGQVDVDLEGESSSRDQEVAQNIQDSLNADGCNKIVDAVNDQLEDKLRNLIMNYNIRDVCYLDFSLVQPPELNSFIGLEHKGEVFPLQSRSEAPFSSPPIPSDPENSSMFYVWLTDYLANSAGYALHSIGYLSYTVTQSSIPAGSKLSLNTSEFPINLLFPTVSKMFPGMLMQLRLRSTAPPMMNTTKTKVTSFVMGNIDAYVMPPNGSLTFMFSLGVKLSLSFEVGTKHQNVTWKAKYESCNLSLVKSEIAEIKIDKLKQMLPMAMKTSIIPKLNQKGAVGVEMKGYQGFALTCTNITQGEGFLKIGTDAKYLGLRYHQKLKF